jgi:hypothetical protein
MLVFGKKFPEEKGIVKRRVVVMQQAVLLSPKFGTNYGRIMVTPSQIQRSGQ